MALPAQHDREAPLVFGGVEAQTAFGTAWAVVVPVPYERTTSYVTGTRGGPREILLASRQVELWDEETRTEVLTAGVHTLPEIDLPAGDDGAAAIAEIRRFVSELARHDKFLAFLGGEHSLTAPVIDALARRTADLSVLQIDAHADLRDSYQGSRYSHACAMRRVVERVPCTQVAIRSLSKEEAEALPSLRTRIFYDANMRRDPSWMDRVVEGLTDRVYLTIDCDGFDPAVMPAVGTPEPGGLSWYEMLGLLRKLFSTRQVIGCDIVELCPIPGLVAPSFTCARLLAKILTYRFMARA
jgi:N1-aminopropylagmatine ureohydrolase